MGRLSGAADECRLLVQTRAGGRVYQQQQQSGEMDCQTADNRCPLATPDGSMEDELGARPYRCDVCRVGFKLKVSVQTEFVRFNLNDV